MKHQRTKPTTALLTALLLWCVLCVAAPHTARAQDGVLDATFTQTGTGFNNDVYAIAVQPDGKVIVGGGFYGV